ncbi:MAG: aspartyl protease family protein [Armatimonadota bacterium]|jgi:predicted aspartyl protease
MGIFYETILVRNILKGGEPIELTVKVDTGATMLVLPGWLQEQLQFPVIRRQLVRYANEETAEREVVYGVEVTVCGRTGVFEAVIEPAKRYGLLGAIVLEALDLIADPRSQRLYVNPRSPDLPMAEIE